MARAFKKIFLLTALAVAAACCISCGIVRVPWLPEVSSGPPSIPGYTPRGTLQEISVPSTVPGISSRKMLVYLPEGYESGTDSYPVIYLLHGARGHETSWIDKGRVIQLSDSLFARRLAEPAIIVMPNMNQYRNDRDYDGGRYKDAFESVFEMDGRVEAAFRNDVVRFMDSHYRTVANKQSRAVLGLSLGAFQSIVLSANNPDLFGFVGAFSPCMMAFGPPSRSRAIYRGLGEKLDSQFDAGGVDYFIYAGRNDFLLPSIQGYHRYLRRNDYPHSFILEPGSHSWKTWRAFYVDLLPQLFKPYEE